MHRGYTEGCAKGVWSVLRGVHGGVHIGCTESA